MSRSPSTWDLHLLNVPYCNPRRRKGKACSNAVCARALRSFFSPPGSSNPWPLHSPRLRRSQLPRRTVTSAQRPSTITSRPGRGRRCFRLGLAGLRWKLDAGSVAPPLRGLQRSELRGLRSAEGAEGPKGRWQMAPGFIVARLRLLWESGGPCCGRRMPGSTGLPWEPSSRPGRGGPLRPKVVGPTSRLKSAKELQRSGLEVGSALGADS